MQIVLAFNYYDRYPFLKDIEKYRVGEYYIHFTGVQKVGVNPNKRHRDPYAVYAYPLEFLFSRSQRLLEGQQYATTYSYYYILQKTNKHPGVQLWKMDWQYLRMLGKANGWLQYFESYKGGLTLNQQALPEHAQSKYYEEAMSKRPLPDIWYQGLVLLDEYKIVPFTKSLRGLDYLEDKNGYINHNEPQQIAFFSPSAYKVVDSGTTNADAMAYKEHRDTDTETKRQKKRVATQMRLSYAYRMFLRAIQHKYNGRIDYARKSIEFDFERAKVVGKLEPKYSGKFDLVLSTLTGNNTGHAMITADDFDRLGSDDLLALLERKLRKTLQDSQLPMDQLWLQKLGEATNKSYADWPTTVRVDKNRYDTSLSVDVESVVEKPVTIGSHRYDVKLMLSSRLSSKDVTTLTNRVHMLIRLDLGYRSNSMVLELKSEPLPVDVGTKVSELRPVFKAADNYSMDSALEKLAKYPRGNSTPREILYSFIYGLLLRLDIGPKLSKALKQELPLELKVGAEEAENVIYYDVFM